MVYYLAMQNYSCQQSPDWTIVDWTGLVDWTTGLISLLNIINILRTVCVNSYVIYLAFNVAIYGAS